MLLLLFQSLLKRMISPLNEVFLTHKFFCVIQVTFLLHVVSLTTAITFPWQSWTSSMTLNSVMMHAFCNSRFKILSTWNSSSDCDDRLSSRSHSNSKSSSSDCGSVLNLCTETVDKSTLLIVLSDGSFFCWQLHSSCDLVPLNSSSSSTSSSTVQPCTQVDRLRNWSVSRLWGSHSHSSLDLTFEIALRNQFAQNSATQNKIKRRSRRRGRRKGEGYIIHIERNVNRFW